MLKDMIQAPRRSSMTSAAILPISGNSLSGESEHTGSDVVIKKSNSRISIMSMKSAPMLTYGSKSYSEKDIPGDVPCHYTSTRTTTTTIHIAIHFTLLFTG
jgi:hypothetical protein